MELIGIRMPVFRLICDKFKERLAKMNRSDEKYNWSFSVYMYATFALSVVLCDYMIYFFRIDYGYMLITSLVISFAFALYLGRKIKWTWPPVYLIDIFFVALIIGTCIWRGIMPDTSFDTSNYHLYFQNYLGRDFINEDFFGIRAVNASAIALGDRMFGAFRVLLGYRMGTFLGAICLILMYFQLKRILNMLGKSLQVDLSSHLSRIIISVAAMVCMITENIYTLIATYMIDLLSIPILLEIVICVWSRRQEDTSLPRYEPLYLCLLTGIVTCIKMSNLIIVFPLALIYLYENWKQLKINDIFMGIGGFVAIIGLYVYISWSITGNPLFPYLNSIFESPYFTTEQSPNDLSAFNVNFGPKGFWEALLWPLIMILNPARQLDVAYCSGSLLITTIAILGLSINELRKRNKKYIDFIFLITIFYIEFLFAFKGYMRYIIILEILERAVVCILLYKVLSQKKRYVYKTISIGVICALAFQIGNSSTAYFKNNIEWAWRDINNKQRVGNNIKMIFHDYDSGIDKIILDDIKTLIVADSSGGLSSMVKNVPIINLVSGVTNEKTAEMLNQRIEQTEINGIYSLGKNADFINNVKVFGEYGLAIKRIIPLTPSFYDASFCIPIIELEKSEKEISVESIVSADVVEYDLMKDASMVNLFIGDNIYEEKWNDIEYQIQIMLKDNLSGEIKELETIDVSQKGIYSLVTLDTEQIGQYGSLVIKRKNVNDSQDGENYCIIIQQFS